MMFMNLTARKDNGDFYITSSEVERDKHPELNDYQLALHMQMLAGMMLTQGWNVELTQDDIKDPQRYAEDSADADAIYYGA
jgi:endonuclease YncB( thermonuclease family)